MFSFLKILLLLPFLLRAALAFNVLPSTVQVKNPTISTTVSPNFFKSPTLDTHAFNSLSSTFSDRARLILSSTAVLARHVETQLPGIYASNAKSKYTIDFDWITGGITIWQRLLGALKFFFLGGLFDLFRVMKATYGRKIPVTVYDARIKEKEEGLSKSEFFNKYGFVILEHKSAMSAEGWIASDRDFNKIIKASGDEYKKIMDEFRNGDTPVKRIYAKEVEELVRSILPKATLVMPPARGVRRYLTRNPNKQPAKTVHNDYGLLFDEVVENRFFDFKDQRAKYEEENATEYMLVNFWRPILPMSTSCRSFPLAFLDSSKLSADDFVKVDQKSFGIVTQLKENSKHKYYFYPDMNVNEVVMFKQFHQVRNESIARMPVFHTAFTDPAANKETEGRVSFEYRVGILC